MAVGAFVAYDDFMELLGDDHGGLDALTFKLGLYLSTSNANTGTLALLSELTNEHANGNGYTTGGATMANSAWTETAGTAKLDSDDVVWTASGGPITARFGVIYILGTIAGRVNPLVARSLLDDAPADVSASDTNTLTIAPHANGILTLARA